MPALSRLTALPLVALQHAGIDPSSLVGVARLVAKGCIRPVSPGAIAHLARDVARRGRGGINGLVHLHAQNTPYRPAMVFGDTRFTWRDLDARINRLAHGLLRLGVRPKDRVATLLHNCPEQIEISCALGHLGATSVPIGYRLKPKEVAFVLKDAGVRALFFHPQFAATVEEALKDGGGPERGACVVVPDHAKREEAETGFVSYAQLLEGGDPSEPPTVEGGGYGGIMVYTSGTTGRPKGASRDLKEMSFGPTLNLLADIGMRHDERHLVCSPVYHSAGAFFTTLTIALGGTLVLLDRFEPEAVLRAIERERVTSMMLVPTMWNRLLQVGLPALRRFDLSSLKWIMSAAAPLPTDLAGRIEEAFGPILFNFYAATETGVVTLARPGEHTARPGTIGRIVRGTEIRLIGKDGADVPDGEVGEIYVRSGMLVDGYHGNAEATRAAQKDGFFSVGDLGRRDADGFYYLADRKTDMVISGGVNIYPFEIEQRLHSHPAVWEAAVVGYPDPEWGESLAAFVALRPEMDASDAELSAWVTAELADFKRPRQVHFVDALPRNPTGKVLKRELQQRLAQAAKEATRP